MIQIMVAFITGLTTGGLSCLAVQGGLLASSLAHQLELDIQSMPAPARGKKNRAKAPASFKPHIAQPILLFLAAKITAYTALGFLLGALGSVLQLTPFTRAVLQIGIGIFMLGTALRMLNVHPIFRYFAFEPPAGVTRYIRKLSKKGADNLTPLFLGALTLLIPCGVTQAMMAVAIGTANPLMGAAIMFAFTVGASPVFFLVAYFASQLGAKLEKYFMRIVAVVVLILGLVAINSGLNLMGSPLSFSSISRSAMGILLPAESTSPSVLDSSSTNSDSATTLILKAQNNGYRPQILHATAGVPVLLNVVTQNTFSCSRAFLIPTLDVGVVLPETGSVPINIPPQQKGSVMSFTCSMGMYTGQIVFDK